MSKTLLNFLLVGRWEVRPTVLSKTSYNIKIKDQNYYEFYIDLTQSIYSVNPGYWNPADRGADVSLIVGQVWGEGWDDCHKPGHKLAITLSLLLYGIRNESLTSQSVSDPVFN